MKTINLLIPDGTYDRAVAKASAQGFDFRHYLSNLIIEEIDRTSKVFSLPLRDSSVGKKRATVEQILSVCKHVWHDGMDFSGAVRKVATDLNIEESAVRDKCTRRISFKKAPVNTELFLDMLLKRQPLCDYLCRRFPNEEPEIRQKFSEIMSDPLLNTAARNNLMRSLDDTETW